MDVSFSIGPEYYNFCPVRHLGAPRLLPYIVPPRENVTIINNSVNVTKITNVNDVFIFNEGPDFREIQRRSEQPVRWARLERRWDVDRQVVRAGEVRNRIDGDVFRVVSPRVERRPTREERPARVVATVRNEEFDKRIGEERRRVRERTREMNRSAEADIPPPPDGRDQRFEPSRQDSREVPENQQVTEQQRRREHGSRELPSETIRDNQRNGDQTPGRDRQRREERRDGPENSSQHHHLRTRRGWKRTNQERQATNLVARNGPADAAMGKGGRRAAKCEEIRRAETRSAENSVATTNLKNLFKELLLLRSQETRQRGRLLAKKLRTARIRHSGLRKIVGRTAERRKKRTGSASKAAA